MKSRIRYDGSGELFITDIETAATCDKDDLDRVITVCQDSIGANISDSCAYAHYCMSDGPANGYGGRHDYEFFAEAADELHDALDSGESVLIHCHNGQSRSTSVAMAALGRLCNCRADEAYDLVERYRPQATPDRLLYEHMQRYIDEHND